MAQEEKPSILIVDDTPENIRILVSLLKDEFRTLVATNGAKALEHATGPNPPDLVLLDIMMPEMDGYEVCRRLKADPQTAEIPVIFITAMSEVDDEARGLGLGAVDYITKPFSPTIVEARVRTQLSLYQMRRAIEQKNRENEELLLNILPGPIAERLKSGEQLIADTFEGVTVLFADIVGFTALSSSMAPREILDLLSSVFGEFDKLVEKHGVEKIKTIGDCYMVVAGVPRPRDDHAQALAEVALGMLEAVERVNASNERPIQIRLGMHSGSVVAGVIGASKFIYDLWGDTVNTASRMESNGLPSRIQVTQESHDLLTGDFTFEERGEIEVKGKGALHTWWLTRARG
jgi:adenylate cyclase